MQSLKYFISQLLLLLGCVAAVAKTPCIVPAPAEYHSMRGAFKSTAAPQVYVSQQSNINPEVALGWLSEMGLNCTTTTDSAAAAISLLLQPGVTGNAEGYTLNISPKSITIAADGNTGLIWGLQTLRQIYRSEGTLRCCSITDYPLYPWRSYLLDESRHFFGKEAAMRVIDELSRLKINTLHWHLTDGAGWRLEVPRYPLLTEVGSKMDYSHRGISPESWDSIHPARAYYNADEIREIVAYARDRGVKVMPEIDIPGHSLAAITAYPWLGTSSRLAGAPVTGDVLQVSDPEVEQFMRNVLSYAIDLFDTDIIHIGGDEVDYKHWREAEGVSAYMAENGLKEPWQLQHRFMKRMAEYLFREKECHVIGWNEITGHANDTVIVPGTITQFWEGDTSKISKAIAQGYKVVNSAQLFTYLDYDYQGTPLWKTYRHHPSPDANSSNIIGFGAQMWTENVPDFAQLCYMTFPRLAALAECGWTAPENKDYADFIRRIAPLQQYWRTTGILHGQPSYSTGEPNAILPAKYSPKAK